MYKIFEKFESNNIVCLLDFQENTIIISPYNQATAGHKIKQCVQLPSKSDLVAIKAMPIASLGLPYFKEEVLEYCYYFVYRFPEG